MTENVEKLNELASADEALAKRLTGAQDKEAVTAIAAEAGITLTDADFEAIEAQRKRTILARGGEKLSDDELDAVAGGDKCFCIAGGGGVYRSGTTKFYDRKGADLTCGCVLYGQGYHAQESREWDEVRCTCVGGGVGESVLV